MPGLLNSFNRRGAMFGLDARIALITFAGLGFAAGAMIYKAASQSRVGALAAELNNVSKAFGDYMMDVGSAPARIEDLITSAASGWNGPYVPYVDNHPGNNVVYYMKGNINSMSLMYYDGNASWPVGAENPCTPGDCWAWLYIGGDAMTELMAEDLDMAFDKAHDFESGVFRCEPGVFPDGTCALRLGSVRTPGN